MKKLFIIGNGFDLAHKMETKYEHFKVFLTEKCSGQVSYLPITYFGRDGDTVPDIEATAGLLLDLIDCATTNEDWRDFEEAMARFDYSQYFDDLDIDEAIEDDDDDEMFRVAYDREDRASDLKSCVSIIKNLFGEWIDTIDTCNVSKIATYSNLFDKDSIFLTFNYTDTLETVYGVDENKICHIHGKQGEEIIVGHGEIDNPYEEESWEMLAIQDALFDLYEALKKDVDGCLFKHQDFFYKLNDIQEIYSIGFGFADVDLPYIQKICSKINTHDVTWHLTKYDEQIGYVTKYEGIIRECGFKGKFGQLV